MSDSKMKDRQEALQNRAGGEIRQIMTDLHTVAKDDNFKMPEDLFKAAFLPMFAGEKVADARITPAFYVSTIGGNASRRVDVVDVTGTVLFTVPPIVNRETLRTAQGGGANSFSEIMAYYSMIQQNSAAAADGYLHESLEKKNLLQYDTEEGIAEARLWNDIFIRYGRPPIFDLPPLVDGKKSESTASLSLSDNGFDTGF